MQAATNKATFEVLASRKPTQADLEQLPKGVIGLSRQDRVVRAYDRIDSISPFNQVPGGTVQGHPIRFCGIALATLDEAVENVKIRAELEISNTGKLKHIEVLDSNASPKLERLFRRIAGVNRYLPQFENGKPVSSKLVIEQDFALQQNNSDQVRHADIANIHACHRVAQRYRTAPALANIE